MLQLSSNYLHGMYINVYVPRNLRICAISRLRCAFSESWDCAPISRLRNYHKRAILRLHDLHAQSTNFQLYQYAWQWAIYCACVVRRMEDSLDKASIGGLLRLEEWVMLCVDKQRRRFVPRHTEELLWIYGISYNFKVVFFMLLGICLRIMCFTPNVWKVRSAKWWSAVETTPCCPPSIPFTCRRAK